MTLDGRDLLDLRLALGLLERAYRADGWYVDADRVHRLQGALRPVVDDVRAIVAGQRCTVSGSVSDSARSGSARNTRVSIAQAADLLGLSGRAVRYRCERGQFVTARQDRGGRWSVERSEVVKESKGRT